ADAARAAKDGQLLGFGASDDAAARLLDFALKADCMKGRARLLGGDVNYRVGAEGQHMVLISLTVLAAAKLAGHDHVVAAVALTDLVPPTGRGRRLTLDVAGGKALLIDESYNANPASMRAALEVLGQAPIGRRGRRIAVLGDMLELGPDGPELHRGLTEAVAA